MTSQAASPDIRPAFSNWLFATLRGGQDDWMRWTAQVYNYWAKELRESYLKKDSGDKRLEWLKDLTVENVKISAENLRSFIIAISTALVSFVAAQLSDKVPPLPLAVNVGAVAIALLATFSLALYHQFVQIHLS